MSPEISTTLPDNLIAKIGNSFFTPQFSSGSVLNIPSHLASQPSIQLGNFSSDPCQIATF